MKYLRVFCAFLFLSTVAVIDAHAIWYFHGNQVSVGNYNQMTALSSASDGAGGMVVVWSTDEHVYAKRYDSTGALVSGWSLVTVGDVDDTPNEAPRITFNGTYWYVAWIDPHMVAGGGGTSIPGYIIRLAKLKNTGSVFHTASVFDSTSNDAKYLSIAKRSGGGVALGWQNERDWGHSHVYLGYIHYFRTDLNNGSWAGPVSISPAPTFPVQVITNNINGTIMVYSTGMGQSVMADSTASGTSQAAIAVSSGFVVDFSAISDGSGGAVMAFDVTESGTYYRIWLQHLASNDATQWNQGSGVIGQPLCISSCSGVGGAQLVLNSAGTDAIMTWWGGTGATTYAQKFPLSGAFSRTTWGAGGKTVSTTNTGNSLATPVANEDGYTTVFWTYALGGSVFDVRYQILEDDGDPVMGAEGIAATNEPTTYIGSIVAGYDLNSFGTWWVYDGDNTDLRAARLVPIWNVDWGFVEDRCRTNLSWETVASGTTNRLDYRRIGATPWTTKTPTGSSGSYSSYYPQYLPSEFKLRTTISSVEYESLVYQDYGTCGEPDPNGMRVELGVKEPYLTAQPNPFNPVVTIGYGVPGTLPVDLAIYDVSGHRVTTLVSGIRHSGEYRTTWTGENNRGEHVASGVYFSRLTVGTKVLTQKLVMLK